MAWNLPRLEPTNSTDRQTEAHRRRQTPARYSTYETSLEYEALIFFTRYLFWPFVQARTVWAGEGLSRSSTPLMLTHEMDPLLAIYVWISAKIS